MRPYTVGPPDPGGTALDDDPDFGARSALYTLVYFEGKLFTDMCMADHAAARRVGVRGGGGGGGGGSSWGAAAAPAGGLRELLARARRELPGHTLGLLVEGLTAHCTARERKEFKSNGTAG